MIEFEEALSIIENEAQSLFEDELISLDEADGRILAEDIYADRDYPPFNRCAMDGFAIKLQDWRAGVRRYKVVKTVFAGQTSGTKLKLGECYKIMTGAPVPNDANVVIRREDAIEEDEEVVLSGDEIKEFKNISPKGEDTKQGKLIIKSQQFCSPQIISLLATVGKAFIKVRKLPTVSVITTGNEVVLPEEEISPVKIRNSNRYLLKSLLKTWQIAPAICRHVNDDKKELEETLKEALQNEVTIINGGVSAGDADYVPEILRKLGVKELFHKVKIKPGKPIWVGKSETGIVFALPGNPLSCLITFTIFVESYLYKKFGLEKKPSHYINLLQKREKKSNLTEFFPVFFSVESNGLSLKDYNGSGDVTASYATSGLGVQPTQKMSIQAGETVKFYPFKKLI